MPIRSQAICLLLAGNSLLKGMFNTFVSNSCQRMRIGLKFLLFFLAGNTFSQDTLKFFCPSPEFNNNRFISVASLQVVGYGGSLALLSVAWYNDYSKSSFHSFDDFPEWLQMDKAGHLITSWYLGRISSDMYEWSGVKKKKAVLYGGLSGWGYLTAIEVMDGFSEGWGFSWTDFSANTIGTGLVIAQKTSNIRWFKGMSLKFSFHQTDFPLYRPSLLGKNISEQIIKDYNGQSYWLSFNISSFMKHETKFPKWLNFAIGYGGEYMIAGSPNDFYVDANGNSFWMERYRQYYFSLDIDLSRIKTKSHFLKTVFETISFIKIPAPALEVNKKGMKFHSIYY